MQNVSLFSSNLNLQLNRLVSEASVGLGSNVYLEQSTIQLFGSLSHEPITSPHSGLEAPVRLHGFLLYYIAMKRWRTSPLATQRIYLSLLVLFDVVIL
jgi:hypothetical protein